MSFLFHPTANHSCEEIEKEIKEKLITKFENSKLAKQNNQTINLKVEKATTKYGSKDIHKTYHIKQINGVEVITEPLRKSQCKKCHSSEHSNHCKRKPRCVKCATESFDKTVYHYYFVSVVEKATQLVVEEKTKKMTNISKLTNTTITKKLKKLQSILLKVKGKTYRKIT